MTSVSEEGYNSLVKKASIPKPERAQRARPVRADTDHIEDAGCRSRLGRHRPGDQTGALVQRQGSVSPAARYKVCFGLVHPRHAAAARSDVRCRRRDER